MQLTATFDITLKQKMIRNYLKSFNALTGIEIENLIHLSSKRDLDKADCFIREGETCKEVAFVLSGTFLEFLKTSPDKIVQRTPLIHVASFLGMAPESLSRIRKTIS